MTYLVMECHPAYALVLDERGRLLRVPNLGYEVGQTLGAVVTFDDGVLAFDAAPRRRRRSRLVAVLAAACLCAAVIGGFAVWQTPIGTVRMSINPEVEIDVNRFDRVVALEGENDDGRRLIENFAYYGRTVDEVSDDLADRAEDQGYLEDGGRIEISVESDDEGWKTATEDRLVIELEVHLDHRVVVTGREGGPADTAAPGTTEPPAQEMVPEPAPEVVAPSDDDDDDDWDDDDYGAGDDWDDDYGAGDDWDDDDDDSDDDWDDDDDDDDDDDGDDDGGDDDDDD